MVKNFFCKDNKKMLILKVGFWEGVWGIDQDKYEKCLQSLHLALIEGVGGGLLR